MVQNNTTTVNPEKAMEVAQILDEGATHVYEVLVGAQPILGLLMIAQALIVVVPTLAVSLYTYSVLEDEDPDDRVFSTVVIFSLTITITITTALFVGDVFVHIFLPEYSAIQEVLESL